MSSRLASRVARTLLGACAVWLAARAYAALRPTAYPYFARAFLDLPHALVTRRRLLEILDPAPGERMLEIGPGTGYHTLPVAARLAPGGTLEIFDVRLRFLDHTMARAREAGLSNVVATRGDGRSLPYPDASFDAAYLVSVLGEIPDPRAALHELRRVLKPTGRIIVGEMFIDPDVSRLRWLVRQAAAAGLVLERRSGPSFGYYARFKPTSSPLVAVDAHEERAEASEIDSARQ